jgi:hypothetical protein
MLLKLLGRITWFLGRVTWFVLKVVAPPLARRTQHRLSGSQPRSIRAESQLDQVGGGPSSGVPTWPAGNCVRSPWAILTRST